MIIKFKTLRGRLIFYFSIIIVLTLVLSALMATGFVRFYIWETTVAELNRQADIIAVQIQNETLPRERLLAAAEKMSQTRIVLVKAPLLNSNLNRLPLNKRPDILRQRFNEPGGPLKNLINWRIMGEGKRQVIQNSRTNDTPSVLVAQPFFLRGNLAGAVVLAKPLKSYQQAWLPIGRRLFLAGVIALIISLVPIFYFAKYLTKPLNKISVAAKSIAAGDFGKTVDVETEDELGELAETFNHMAENVGESVKLRQNFIMNVSHELKTPLTSIQGFTEALMDKAISDPQEEKASLRVIFKESKRLERLVNDLLDLAKLDAKQFSLKKENVALDILLGECRRIYKERAESAKINFTANLDPLPAMFTDGERVQQIVANLLENAFKFTPEGGEVGLKGFVQDGSIIIEISDSGPGIEPAEMPHIFKPFYSSKKSQGSGLGLAIASELSKALEGRLIVSSQIGNGTTFTFRLPVKKQIIQNEAV